MSIDIKGNDNEGYSYEFKDQPVKLTLPKGWRLRGNNFLDGDWTIEPISIQELPCTPHNLIRCDVCAWNAAERNMVPRNVKPGSMSSLSEIIVTGCTSDPRTMSSNLSYGQKIHVPAGHYVGWPCVDCSKEDKK